MTIVRSIGVTTLVALMSAHRAAATCRQPKENAFDQATVEAIETYLRAQPDRDDLPPQTSVPPISYN